MQETVARGLVPRRSPAEDKPPVSNNLNSYSDRLSRGRGQLCRLQPPKSTLATPPPPCYPRSSTISRRPALNIDNVPALLARQTATCRDKTFLIVPDGGPELSYASFATTVYRMANVLRSLGIGHGDKVAILTTNIPEFLFAFFGAMQLGAVAAPINNLLKAAEMQYVLGHSEAKVLLTAPHFLEVVQAIRPSLPDLQSVLVITSNDQQQSGSPLLPGQSTVSFRALLDVASADPPTAEIEPDDEAVILYTSGTTGKPKGVLITHANLLADARDIARWHRLGPDDRTIGVLPLFHVNGEVISTMTPLYSGGSLVLPERFSAGRFWPAVARYRPNWFSAAPTILTILLNTQIDPSLDISSLRFCLCGTAPLPVELHRRFEQTFHIMVLEGYGLTETTCRSTFNPHPPDDDWLPGQSDGHRRLGSVGLPIGNEVKVFDDDDREVAARIVGEVVVRGANVIKAYYRDAAATAETMRSGWLHTGDLGYKDEDGYLYITDRKKDMIIRGGENIYPREVDEVLYLHPKVRQAAAVGVPDAKYGEDVMAFVVLAEGETATEEEILAFCRARLADYKCPKAIRFLEDIPKGPTGKLLRRRLRELYINTM